MNDLEVANLVHLMSLEVKKLKYSNDYHAIEYFIWGFNVSLREGANPVAYWREVIKLYPNLVDIFYKEMLYDINLSNEVKCFFEKMVILK